MNYEVFNAGAGEPPAVPVLEYEEFAAMIYVGILGGGNISETHAPAAHETDGVEVAAIYGQNQEKAARLSESFGGKVCGNSAKVIRAGLDRYSLLVAAVGGLVFLITYHGIFRRSGSSV